MTLPVPAEVQALYKGRKGRFDTVTVPPMMIAYVDGKGAPPSDAFSNAIGALFAVSFTAKFAVKAETGDSPKVLPVASQWTMAKARKDWEWTMLIPQLPPIDAAAIRKAVKACKTKQDNPALDLVKAKTLREGMCAQTIHVGPYDTVGTTVDAMYAWIAEHGYTPAGRYHEIYMSDPNRTAPEKLRTLCRVPVKRA